ncbi:hypothetical protein GIB67_031893 [Kingdonia uniflora]|uniref:Transposase MuDR plant domain-containing protein n=1 Tax=Kingdonia uniflora TaxID=39325 RepID=A0A7J7NTE7_9MAGN|nr:hypothetical protein GIB67_031893 [Kingdonia uniflora]
MSEMNATFQPGVVLDVMTLYLGNKFLVRNDTDLLKMWKMSDVESLWDAHFYIEQMDEVPLGIIDPIDLDTIPKVLLIDSDDDAPIEEIATQVEPIVEPIVFNIQAQRPKKLVTKPRLKKKKTLLKLVDEEDVEQVQVEVQVPERVQDQEQVYKGKRKNESTTRSEPKTKKTRPSELLEEALDELPPLYFSDDEVIVENTDVGGNTVGEGVEDMGGNTVDGEHRGGVGDMGVNTDNWSELDLDNLNAEEGYYSTHTSQDGDDGPTQENIDRCDLEFRDLAKEYDNIFAEEEDAVHSVPPQPTYGELRVGMEWETVYECKAYIRQWSIMNKFEYCQEKNENYRVRLFCIDENCEWMFYAKRTTDGHTFTLRKSSNLKHACSSGTKNRLANATWVAKKVESVIRSVRTTLPAGIQDFISTQFGVDISYYTSWNAWSICKENIVGSYDEGYIMQPELCLQILYLNPGIIDVVCKDHNTSQWTGTYVMFKASIDGFLNGCRPVVGLDGCFLKGEECMGFGQRTGMSLGQVLVMEPNADNRRVTKNGYRARVADNPCGPLLLETIYEGASVHLCGLCYKMGHRDSACAEIIEDNNLGDLRGCQPHPGTTRLNPSPSRMEIERVSHRSRYREVAVLGPQEGEPVPLPPRPHWPGKGKGTMIRGLLRQQFQTSRRDVSGLDDDPTDPLDRPPCRSNDDFLDFADLPVLLWQGLRMGVGQLPGQQGIGMFLIGSSRSGELQSDLAVPLPLRPVTSLVGTMSSSTRGPASQGSRYTRRVTRPYLGYLLSSSQDRLSIKTPWVPPALGWEKINVDASFCNNKLFNCIVLVIQDAHNAFGTARVSSRQFASSKEGEALAVMDGVLWAKARGVLKVVIETDAEAICPFCKNGCAAVSWTTKNILQDCLALFHLFVDIRICYVPRSANLVAHTLAARPLGDNFLWS